MPKKKHKLEIDPLSDLSIIGLSSVENELRLCWLLNQKLRINFQLDSPVFKKISGSDQSFVTYSAYDDSGFVKFLLTKNSNDEHWLLPELKALDYLLIIRGDSSERIVAELIPVLRKIPEITGTFKVSKAALKSLRKIILD